MIDATMKQPQGQDPQGKGQNSEDKVKTLEVKAEDKKFCP